MTKEKRKQPRPARGTRRRTRSKPGPMRYPQPLRMTLALSEAIMNQVLSLVVGGHWVVLQQYSRDVGVIVPICEACRLLPPHAAERLSAITDIGLDSEQ